MTFESSKNAPRMSRKSRLILSAIFNFFFAAGFCGFGIFGLCNDALPGAIFCLVSAALFVGAFVLSVKFIRNDLRITSPGRAKILRIISAVLAWLLAFIFVSQLVATVIIYEVIFNDHFETYGPYSLSVDDFPGLRVAECKFESDKGQLLAGYKYYRDELSEPKGVAVLAHGFGGGGQSAYMAVANFFATNGYVVFAYDATGNDKSEGGSTRGLPQGLIDLCHAIEYVESDESMKELPIVLFGHSWGGYSVSNALNIHPEVKAVVEVAGFDRSSDMLESYAVNAVGGIAKLTMPFVMAYERLKFGDYAGCTAVKGFENSDAGVFVIHSSDDTTVLIDYGYDKYYEKFGGDDRFVFVRYEDRGHGRPFYSDASREYIKDFNERFGEEFGNKNKIDPAEKEKYMYENLDKSKFYDLDAGLFEKILAFCDSNVGR